MKGLKFAVAALVAVCAFAFTTPNISFTKKTKFAYYYLQGGVFHGVASIQDAKDATNCVESVNSDCAQIYEQARLTFDGSDNVTGIAIDQSTGDPFEPNLKLYVRGS